MAVQQHYYTSCVNHRTGRVGFQTKAMSPGLDERTLDMLLPLLEYRIPSSYSVTDIDHHPVSLRYYVAKDETSGQRGILLCTRSSGQDDVGRPGNFFAQSLILDDDVLRETTPILYWNHPLWDHDNAAVESDTPLPVLDRLPPPDQTAIDTAAIWAFLDDDNRRQWFHALLCAVVERQDDSRPIVIVDTADRVAYWIAAITYALAPRYRPLLTFATYHHSPVQAPFLITGTTPDSDFMRSGRYEGYFVLDPDKESIAPATPSPYADYVVKLFDPTHYGEQLGLFFDFCTAQTYGDRVVSFKHLDDLAILYSIITRAQSAYIGMMEANIVATTLDRCTIGPSPRDVALPRLATAIRHALSSDAPIPLIDLYGRATSLASARGATLAGSVKQDLELVVKLVVKGHRAEAAHLLDTLNILYQEESLRSAVNDPLFIATLSATMPDPTLAVAIWALLGGLITVQTDTTPVLDATFQALAMLDPAISIDDDRALLVGLQRAAIGREVLALEQMYLWYIEHPTIAAPVFKRVYVALTRHQPIAARSDIHHCLDTLNLPADIYSDSYSSELEHDLDEAGINGAGEVLHEWLQYASDHAALPATVFAQGVNYLWPRVSERDRPSFARSILGQVQSIELVLLVVEPLLLHAAFGSLPDNPSQTDIEIYRGYARDTRLSPETRTSMITHVLMLDDSLDADIEIMERLHDCLARVGEHEYTHSVWLLLDRYLRRGADINAYAHIVKTTYVLRRQHNFWQLHWLAFADLYSEATNSSWILTILRFWFERAWSEFGQHAYLAPQLFLGLGDSLEISRQQKAWNSVVGYLEINAAGDAWHPLIRTWLQPTKQRFFGLGNKR